MKALLASVMAALRMTMIACALASHTLVVASLHAQLPADTALATTRLNPSVGHLPAIAEFNPLAIQPEALESPCWRAPLSGGVTALSRSLAMAQRRTSRRPYVVAGAILGAMTGVGIYAWRADDSGDGDFGAVVNLPLVVLTGTALGAAAGWIAGGVAGAP